MNNRLLTVKFSVIQVIKTSTVLSKYHFLCPPADAGNQLVAQEAVRKPSLLRRPPTRTAEISSKQQRLRGTVAGSHARGV